MGYFGSKATSGLCQPLIAMMPPHAAYIETHLGGGAIMKRKPPALRNIGIDRDARALDVFECDYPVELVHGCAHRFLAEFTFEGTELVYCDPPYLKRTRRSKRRYRFDYEDCDHEALLELLAALPCQVMVRPFVLDILASFSGSDHGRRHGLRSAARWLSLPVPASCRIVRKLGAVYSLFTMIQISVCARRRPG